MTFNEIDRNGHCLYHAVRIHVGQDQHGLRQIVAAYIEHNKEFLNNLLQLTAGQSVNEYLTGVRFGTEWATHVETEVLLPLLYRPIIFINTKGKIINSEYLMSILNIFFWPRA